jgi:hypothetical protein
MEIEMSIYTLNQILSIESHIKENDLYFNFSDDILEQINDLNNKVSSPQYIKTPIFNSNTGYDKKKKRKPEPSFQDLIAMRNFKSTNIPKKEGLEKELTEIRSMMNKLTDNNFKKLYELIDEKISVLINDEDFKNVNDEIPLKNRIANLIFNLSLNNRISIPVYSRMIQKLIEKYDFIKDKVNNENNNYINNFENIESCSSDENYELFCSINQKNDKRKNISILLTNLYNLGIIDENIFIKNFLSIIDLEINNMKDENLKYLNDEIGENIFYILTEIRLKKIKSTNKWINMRNNIEIISKIKTSENKGIGSKNKFKHMDILDHLKKYN